MSMTVSVRIEHAKENKANGQRKHDLRVGREPSYVAADRVKYNSIIIIPMTASQLRYECIKRRERKDYMRAMKKDGVIATNGIITFGTEAQDVINAMTMQQQDALFKRTADQIAMEMKTTLSGLVVHRDESAIHAHFQCIGYRTDGEQVQKHTNTTLLKRLQDVAGETFKSLGINRGKAKVERVRLGEDASTWVHRSVRQLHNDLPKEIEAARLKLNKNQRLLENTAQKLAQGLGDAQKLQKRMETYEKRVNDANEFLNRHELPKSFVVELVVMKRRRFLGLLPPTIQTIKSKAMKPGEVLSWAKSMADKLLQESARADKAERKYKSASEQYLTLVDKQIKQSNQRTRAMVDEEPRGLECVFHPNTTMPLLPSHRQEQWTETGAAQNAEVGAGICI